MATVKHLTIAMRDTIQGRLMAARFEGREKQLAAAAKVLGQEVYAALVPEAHRRLMARLPDEYFQTGTELTLQLRSANHCVCRFPLVPPQGLPPRWLRGPVAREDVPEEVWDKAKTWLAAMSALQAEKERTASELRVALGQFATVKPLLEAIPELAELCPELVAEKPLVPVCMTRLREIVVAAVNQGTPAPQAAEVKP